MSRWRRRCLGGLLALLVACSAAPPRAPVEDRQGELKTYDRVRTYRVTGGDTLYAIAWRYGLDYRKLASANNIASPYRIYPGQTLRLASAPVATSPTSSNPVAPAATESANQQASAPLPQPQPPPGAAEAAIVAGTPARVLEVDPDAGLATVSAWRWPTRGKVVRGFSQTVHKGIDIDGAAGDAVVAVATGRVVYAGSGIVGYGNLLIVKHNELYLSAYGHNRRLLVAEGDVVAAGQRIAEKGSSATNSVKLHFEIRREGQPIDPKKLLPQS